MGKILIVKGADFAINGIHLINEVDLISVFQAKALPVGTALSYDPTLHTVSETSTTTRIAVKDAIVSTGYSAVTFTLKSGYEIALLAENSTSEAYAITNAGGNLVTGTNTPWDWVTGTNTITILTSTYDKFSFNIRHSDNTTFTSNDLTNCFESIIGFAG